MEWTGSVSGPMKLVAPIVAALLIALLWVGVMAPRAAAGPETQPSRTRTVSVAR